jgi:transcriptional regulator with XRE-family HTH domain
MVDHKTNSDENWLGERLREAAKEAGLPSEAIGRRMNRSGAAIRRYWDGTRNINLEDLKTYAAITNYPLDYFLHKERRLPENQHIRQKFDRLVSEVEELRKELETPNIKYVRATSGNMVPVPADSSPSQADIDKIDQILHGGDCMSERIA